MTGYPLLIVCLFVGCRIQTLAMTSTVWTQTRCLDTMPQMITGRPRGHIVVAEKPRVAP